MLKHHAGRLARRLLILSVLTAMLIAVIYAGRPAEARYCPYYDDCVNFYYACRDSCLGNQTCISGCQQDYIQCQCTNCNLCPGGGGDPRDLRSNHGRAGFALSPGTANGRVSTVLTAAYF
jgi:hypothetical protein